MVSRDTRQQPLHLREDSAQHKNNQRDRHQHKGAKQDTSSTRWKQSLDHQTLRIKIAKDAKEDKRSTHSDEQAPED